MLTISLSRLYHSTHGEENRRVEQHLSVPEKQTQGCLLPTLPEPQFRFQDTVRQPHGMRNLSSALLVNPANRIALCNFRPQEDDKEVAFSSQPGNLFAALQSSEGFLLQSRHSYLPDALRSVGPGRHERVS